MRLSPLELRLRHWGPPGEWFCTPYSSAPGDLCWDAGPGTPLPGCGRGVRGLPVTSLKRVLRRVTRPWPSR
ncbi:hypothetical protein SFR_4385 [Streptomyces sp. FR-008]|nr:hypothetical protein SFR_4385 [Streptomyces sp. FR-008]